MVILSCLLLLSSVCLLAKGQVAGGTINTVDQTQIDNALEVILNDGGILEFSRIAIGLANEGNRLLTNPKWYLHNGNTDHAMPLNVNSVQTGLNLFTRDSISLSGTEGVLTYDIEGTSLCIAVMWNVPNIGSNTMNVKIYPQLTPNEDLYDQMRDVAGEWGTDQWGTREEYGVVYRGWISTGWSVKQIVYINTSGYNFNLGPHYNAWCDKPLIGTDYCRRECGPPSLGECETTFECDDDVDCDGDRLTCSSSCD